MGCGISRPALEEPQGAQIFWEHWELQEQSCSGSHLLQARSRRIIPATKPLVQHPPKRHPPKKVALDRTLITGLPSPSQLSSLPSSHPGGSVPRWLSPCHLGVLPASPKPSRSSSRAPRAGAALLLPFPGHVLLEF